MIKHILLAAIVFCFISAGSSCQADLIIEIQDHTMQSGTTSSVNVFVRNNTAAPVEFGLISLRFNISDPGATTGVLEFQASHNSADVNRQSDSERGQLDYVIPAANLDGAAGAFSSTRQDASNNRRALVQADRILGAVPFGGTISISDTPRLLATLELQHISPTPVSGTFEISLDTTATDTFFRQFPATNVPIASSSSGTITVSPVPEPSSALILPMAACVLSRFRRRRS